MFACVVYLRDLANRVIKEENKDLGGKEDFGDQYREYLPEPEDPCPEDDFAKDADGGKSNIFPLIILIRLYKHNP